MPQNIVSLAMIGLFSFRQPIHTQPDVGVRHCGMHMRFSAHCSHTPDDSGGIHACMRIPRYNALGVSLGNLCLHQKQHGVSQDSLVSA